jgi:hypothetical protein
MGLESLVVPAAIAAYYYRILVGLSDAVKVDRLIKLSVFV